MQDLVAITNAVNVQTQAHATLGEQAAAMYCLQDFDRLIEMHNLNDRDTMLNLVGSVKHRDRVDGLVDGFLQISENVEKVTESFELGETVTPRLIVGNADNGNSDESKEEAQHDEAKA